MRFGLRLVQHVGPARGLVRLAALAEEVGFDAVWFPHDPFMKHAWAMAAAVAENTSCVQIGSVQTTPYLNEPSEAATFLATLDELSGGRARRRARAARRRSRSNGLMARLAPFQPSRNVEGRYVSEVLSMLTYRPELFGNPFSEALQDVMRGESEWSVGERELFATFVSCQNQCPF